MCQFDTYTEEGCFFPPPATPVMKELYIKMFITSAVLLIISGVALRSIGQTARDWKNLPYITPPNQSLYYTFIGEIYACKVVAYASVMFVGGRSIYKSYRQLNNPVHIIGGEVRRAWNDLF